MKNILFFCMILVICSTLSYGQNRAAANQTLGKLGAGIVMGQPNGLSWKYRFDRSNALEGTIGLLPDNNYRVNIDYLWHTHPFTNERFGFDYGTGVAFGPGRTDLADLHNSYAYQDDEVGFGLSGVGGVNYLIPQVPMDAFLEFVPIMVLTPRVTMDVDVGFGMRAYF